MVPTFSAKSKPIALVESSDEEAQFVLGSEDEKPKMSGHRPHALPGIVLMTLLRPMTFAEALITCKGLLVLYACLQAKAPGRKTAAALSSTAKEVSESSEEEKPKVCGHCI